MVPVAPMVSGFLWSTVSGRGVLGLGGVGSAGLRWEAVQRGGLERGGAVCQSVVMVCAGLSTPQTQLPLHGISTSLSLRL